MIATSEPAAAQFRLGLAGRVETTSVSGISLKGFPEEMEIFAVA